MKPLLVGHEVIVGLGICRQPGFPSLAVAAATALAAAAALAAALFAVAVRCALGLIAVI
jgi:hypothetical protein